MNYFEIAAMIAAIAFAVLVIYLIVILVNVNQTIKVINKTVEPVMGDVKDISTAARFASIDIAKKIDNLDPVVTAAADLGESVSHFAKKHNGEESQSKTAAQTAADLATSAIKSGVATQAGAAVVKKILNRKKKTTTTSTKGE